MPGKILPRKSCQPVVICLPSGMNFQSVSRYVYIPRSHIMIDLENLSQDELERLAVAARKKAEEKKAVEKYENLRSEAIEAVKNAPAERLPVILAALKGRKKRGTAVPKTKNTYRWDDSLSKNRQVNSDGHFVEPPVFMRGPAAKNPIR